MAVRRRGITPVVSRYILKSHAHARKSRTKLHTTDRDCGKAWNSSMSATNGAVARATPRRLHRRPHGGVPWFTIGNGAWGHGFYARRCFWWVRVHSAEPMRQILDSEKYRVARLWAICCLWETRDGDCLLVMDGKMDVSDWRENWLGILGTRFLRF